MPNCFKSQDLDQASVGQVVRESSATCSYKLVEQSLARVTQWVVALCSPGKASCQLEISVGMGQPCSSDWVGEVAVELSFA